MVAASLPPLEPGGNLLHNLLLFGRLLKGLGLDINLGRMLDLADALALIEIGRRDDFYYAARGLLVHDREDLPIFDLAFDLFWRVPAREGAYGLTASVTTRRRRPKTAPPPLDSEDESQSDQNAPGREEDEPPVFLITRTYSDREVLRRKDFTELSPEEVEEVKRLMQRLDLKIGLRLTRRLRPGKDGHTIDLRRSIRRSYETGGEILRWSLRERKPRPRPIVVIADISGSMERYTRLLLHFIYGLAHSQSRQVESFVFSTRLTRITRQLRSRSIERALKEVGEEVHDWAGGTRTGDSLKTFNFEWGRRVLGRGAIVLIISDGWDRGDPDLLDVEMGRLHRSCHRLVWLNPLLGSPEYEPLTRGIRTALPHVDDFMPVHNLASLEQLARHIERIGVRG